MTATLRRGLLASFLTLSFAVPVTAQVLRVDDVGSASFGRREGLPPGPILGLTSGRDGAFWVATQLGVRRYSGAGWTTDSVPVDMRTGLVRTIVDAPDGTRFFVRHSDVLHYRGDSLLQRITMPPAATPNYSAVITAALGTVPTLVIGGRQGVFRLSGGKVEPVVLPAGFNAGAAMVYSQTIAAGRDVLWVAAQSGVARRRDGEWTTWGPTDGVNGFVDHVIPGLQGDSVEALAMTPTGGLALVRGAWRPFGPTTGASRVLRIATRHGFETWIGLQGGEILRSHDGVAWDTLAVQGRAQGARVQVLVGMNNGLSEPTVYAGFRNGLLARFRTGAAGHIAGGRAMGSLVDVAGSAASDTVWFGRLGVGAQRMPGFPGPALPARMKSTGTGFFMYAPPSGRTSLFTGDGRNIHRLVAGRWDGGHTLAEGDSARAVVHAAGPDGRVANVVVSRAGALIEGPDGRFVPWPGFPKGNRLAVGDSSGNGTEILTLSDSGVIRRIRGSTITPVPDGDAPLVPYFTSMTSFHHASGERTLWIATQSGIVVVRIDGGPPGWRSFVTSVDRIIASDPVRDLRPLPGGRLAIATGAGVTIVEPGRTMEDSVRFVTNAGEADGLPSSSIVTLGDIDRGGRLWVNTSAGPGFVDLASIDLEASAPSAPLAVTMRTLDGRRVAPGARIRASSGSLQLEASLATHHREEDSRYLIELDGQPMDPSGWSGEGRLSLLALEAGRHEVRIRATDWRGQSSTTTVPFVILPPWWRSGGAILAYLLAIAAAWFVADRIRHRILRERARDAEENERRVAASEARFRRLFEDGGEPQLLVLRGAVWRANAAAETLLAASEGEPLVGLAREVVVPTIPTSADDRPSECEVVSTRGEHIPVELRRTVIPMDDGTIDHLSLRDLREERRHEAERRSLETQLLQSQRLESLGTLAGGVAHDFNNVLTIIQANAEMAERDVPPHSDAADALAQLLAASRRARDIVRQILTFSRRGSTARSPVRLSHLLQGLTQMLRASFPPSVTVEVNDRAHDAWVLGDETQLQQMLLNLCTNAEYAMRARGGGRLAIDVAQVDADTPGSPGEASIRVSDTGVGIPATELSRVFDPFYTTKPVGEGTGLGLSVLHGIVAAHAGRVTVESVVGKGTTFDVRLPLIEPPSRPRDVTAARVVPAAEPRFENGMRVLVVDDEPAVAFVVERLLQEQGFEVTVALSGKAALDVLHGDLRFDALVTDQTMPGMRGDEVARAALAIDPALRVLLMSGYSATVGPSQMAAAGVHGFVEKPFTRDQLLVAIRKVLGKPATPLA